jgi:hypothetical protein
MSLGLTMYLDDHRYYPPNGKGGDINPQENIYWHQRIRPYTTGTWMEGIYDCPGFVLGSDPIMLNPGVPILPKESLEGFGYGEYGYNKLGTGHAGPVKETTLLGLGRDLATPISESAIVQPSDMVALGDTFTEIL